MLFFYQLLDGGLSEEIETAHTLNAGHRPTMTQCIPSRFFVRIRLTICLILRNRHLRDIWRISALSSDSSAFLQCIVDISDKLVLVMFESKVKHVSIQIACFEVFQSPNLVRERHLLFS